METKEPKYLCKQIEKFEDATVDDTNITNLFKEWDYLNVCICEKKRLGGYDAEFIQQEAYIVEEFDIKNHKANIKTQKDGISLNYIVCHNDKDFTSIQTQLGELVDKITENEHDGKIITLKNMGVHESRELELDLDTIYHKEKYEIYRDKNIDNKYLIDYEFVGEDFDGSLHELVNEKMVYDFYNNIWEDGSTKEISLNLAKSSDFKDVELKYI
jgi:hypothetical protein